MLNNITNKMCDWVYETIYVWLILQCQNVWKTLATKKLAIAWHANASAINNVCVCSRKMPNTQTAMRLKVYTQIM